MRTFEFIAANGAVMLGAILQASTGLGSGLIIVPLVALISLEFIPGPIVLASMALSGIMALQGRHHIRTGGLPLLLTFLSIGVALGALSISAIPAHRAGLAFGTLVLIAIGVSVAMPNLQRSKPLVARSLSTSNARAYPPRSKSWETGCPTIA
jgi:uncharacterized membrane protein YfcA